MKKTVKVAITAIVVSLVSTTVWAHSPEKDPMKEAVKYRQSAMSLVGSMFKPMVGMMKGEREWNDAAFAEYAKDFAAVANINHLRGYPEGSKVGNSKAEAAIWKDFADFESKMTAFQKAATALAVAVDNGDKNTIKETFGVAGKSCKGCHKEYKDH